MGVAGPGGRRKRESAVPPGTAEPPAKRAAKAHPTAAATDTADMTDGQVYLADLTTDDSAEAQRGPAMPTDAAQGKSHARSLLQPQPLARRILPADTYDQVRAFADEGAKASCGDPWKPEVVKAALEAGPHVSALTDANVQLIWDDLEYQEQAGFVKIITKAELDERLVDSDVKVSRVAVVPQANRRGRIILNLSAQVQVPGSRRRPPWVHPSVNETTEDADCQEGVKATGTALKAALRFAHDVDPEWEIDWQKIDLSNGFWRMIVEDGAETNFVFQLLRRPGDSTTHYVVPSSLQMGWKNSPAYFCTATEAGRTLLRRLLALTVDTGLADVHPLEHHCLASPRKAGHHPWQPPSDIRVYNRVYVDDYINALAGPPRRPSRVAEQQWLGRCAMHSIHSLFPPPPVTGHQGGKDSISTKKLNQGDARFKLTETILGTDFDGRSKGDRTVTLPEAKKDSYIDSIRRLLNDKRRRIRPAELRPVNGKLQYAAMTMPCMKGYMTPMYEAAASRAEFLPMGRKSVLRHLLTQFEGLLELAHHKPTHITELVGEDLPHYYGTVDAAGSGVGGTWLPCTRWLQPIVWRVPFPPHITNLVTAKKLSMADCESAAYFIHECLLDHLLQGHTAGVNTLVYSDNMATVCWFQRGASRASSKFPEKVLRLMGLRQRWTRRGPMDIRHHPGKHNHMADFPSRSFTEGFPAVPHGSPDTAFLREFNSRFPLPRQLGSWQRAHPQNELISVAFSLLCGTLDTRIQPETVIGASGIGLPVGLAKTLFSVDCKAPPTTWNAATCSWPLLLPCGTVTSQARDLLRDRKSRLRYDIADFAWSPTDMRTLGAQLTANGTSISPSSSTSATGAKTTQPPVRNKHSQVRPSTG